MSESQSSGASGPQVPRTFLEYLRSFGPGIIVVLTWLGAGDIVENAAAGANYGYILMWIVVVAVLMRLIFVSIIAKYQLCNERGEGVLDGLARLSPIFPPVLLVVAIVMGHFYGSYMVKGIGEISANVVGYGPAWLWAVFWIIVALVICLRSVYTRIEWIFKFFLALLAASFLGAAIWVGPNPAGIASGFVPFRFPEQEGAFDSLLIAIGILGAVGGSLMNLVYPYFLDDKGWRGPQFRRVQLYDFVLAMIVMIVINLSIWTLGAELLHKTGGEIKELEDMTSLLSNVLGKGGEILFYLGVFAAVYTSIIGHALGLARLSTHAYLRCKRNDAPTPEESRSHPLYTYVTVWILVSPLIWMLPNMPGFVTLTLVINCAQVVLVPFIAGGLWWITASARYIGATYRNRLWENVVLAVLFILSLCGAYGSVVSVVEKVGELMAG